MLTKNRDLADFGRPSTSDLPLQLFSLLFGMPSDAAESHTWLEFWVLIWMKLYIYSRDDFLETALP